MAVTVDLRVWRAWAVSHRAVPAGVALALACAALTGFARAPVPTWTDRTPLPLWALTPGCVSMIAATCTEDRLSAVGLGPRHRLLPARLIWCTLVVGVCAATTWPMALSTHEPLIPIACGALVALTFGLSSAVGNAAAGLGAVVVAASVTLGSQVPSTDPLRWLVSEGGATCWVVIAAAVVGVGCYVVNGSRSRAHDDAPA